jgi:uncharacterized protein YjlB
MKPEEIFLTNNGAFPNSFLPVLFYKHALKLPVLLRANHVRKLFQSHNWSNNWQAGIFTYHHYHSNTHEVMGVIKGHASIILGGENGRVITLHEGDVLVIPAGVAHKNLGKENDVACIGGYPYGMEYDINYGKEGERPAADERIAKVELPDNDPVTGKEGYLLSIWKPKYNILS